MIASEMKTTAAKTAGGYAVGGATYVAAQHAITLDEAQIYAAIFAAIMTGIYFLGQFAYTIWKWRRESRKE